MAFKKVGNPNRSTLWTLLGANRQSADRFRSKKTI